MKKQGFLRKIGVALGLSLMLTTVAPSAINLMGVGSKEVQASTATYSTTTNLNLRSGSSTKHKVLISIPKGKAVTMISYGSQWSKVKYGSKTGYVSTKYLKKNSSSIVTPKPVPKVNPDVTIKTTYTTISSLTLRTGGSVNYKKILTIPKGKEVKMVSYNSSWSKVTYANKTGYVSTKYLKVNKVEVKPAPTPKPVPAPKPGETKKIPLLTGSASDKILLSAISTDGTGGKLYAKEGSAYYATLLKSTDRLFSARYNVAFVYHDAGKPYSMMINTKVYRDNPHLRKEADKAVLVSTQSFFGVNNSASNEMLKFIKDNMNASGSLEKTVTFGGNKATANISKYDIKIRFN